MQAWVWCIGSSSACVVVVVAGVVVVKLNAEVRRRDTALRVLSAIRHLAGSWPYVVTHTHQSSAAPS